MMFRLQILAAVVYFATAVIGINTRNIDLCQDVKGRCCQWNERIERADEFDPAPMVLFSGGCAGSSAVLGMVRDIAGMSNRHVRNCGTGYELLADIEGGFYGDNLLVNPASLRAFIKLAVHGNRTLLFKGEDRFLRHPQALEMLEKWDAKFVVLKRWNKLDVALCSVRDCFTENFTPSPFGYNVDENGRKIEVCSFRGRGSNETAVTEKIFVNTSNLLDNLAHLITVTNDNNVKFLEAHGAAFQKAGYEDLFAFYSGNSADLLSSTVAWIGLMKAFGVNATYDSVFSYLKQSRSAFKPPQSHSESIANFDGVKNALTSCERPECKTMLNMLRV